MSVSRCVRRCGSSNGRPDRQVSPTDALVHLVVRCRLWCQVPVWARSAPFTRLRITVIPLVARVPGVMWGGTDSTRCDRGWRMSALCVMNAMMRIWPPQIPGTAVNLVDAGNQHRP